MYGLSDRLKPLSAAEEQVLLALWDCTAPATRRDISEKLTATGWAPATVLNFLYRLEEKGWVKGGKAGSQNTYLPTVTRRAYCVAAMRQRMDTLFGGSLPEAVRALASESGASQSQLEQAIRVLAGLTEGDRLVGIISHVGALKDRIDRQVVVRKARTGGSTVELIV